LATSATRARRSPATRCAASSSGRATSRGGLSRGSC
jgi:hypothetical protein